MPFLIWFITGYRSPVRKRKILFQFFRMRKKKYRRIIWCSRHRRDGPSNNNDRLLFVNIMANTNKNYNKTEKKSIIKKCLSIYLFLWLCRFVFFLASFLFEITFCLNVELNNEKPKNQSNWFQLRHVAILVKWECNVRTFVFCLSLNCITNRKWWNSCICTQYLYVRFTALDSRCVIKHRSSG